MLSVHTNASSFRRPCNQDAACSNVCLDCSAANCNIVYSAGTTSGSSSVPNQQQPCLISAVLMQCQSLIVFVVQHVEGK